MSEHSSGPLSGETCIGCGDSSAALCWSCFATPALAAKKYAGEIFRLRAAKRDLLAALTEQLAGTDCDDRDPCSEGNPCRACRARALISQLDRDGQGHDQGGGR